MYKICFYIIISYINCWEIRYVINHKWGKIRMVMTKDLIDQNNNIVDIRTTILTRKIQLDIFLHTQLNND